MTKVPVSNIRNFSIAGHAGSGKTSLSDLMLFKSGIVNRLGKVDDKNSVSDYRPEEQDKGHSLYATPMHCEWNENSLFFLDTPGYADFFGEAISAISVSDTVLIVVNGIEGIEVGTSRAWKLAKQKKIPRVFFINGLDREHSDFEKTLNMLQQTYGVTTCIPFTIPVGRESELKEVVHVLRSQDIPAALTERVNKYKSTLMDTVAEADEELMMRYLDGEELTEEEISLGLHNAILNGDLAPVFAGSVARDTGVTEMLNGIVNLFPNPSLRKTVPLANGGELEISEDGDGYAFVYKSVVDPFTGQMSYLRVYSGSFNSENEIYNVTRRSKERVGHFTLLNGKEQEAIADVGPGYLVSVAKLKTTKINDTMSVSSSSAEFPPLDYPQPTMSYACYSVKRGEEDKITAGLHRLAEEDPTIRVERQPETRELLLSGLGDQHLSMLMERLKLNFKVEVDLRMPKVPYRETITSIGDGKYRHKKQTGGHGQFAEVWLRVEPLPEIEFEFASEVVGGNIPRNFIPSVEKGVVDAMRNGPLANCRVINVKAVVYDGKYHSVDSSDIAFQIAGRSAFRLAVKEARPILLEPIMTLTITIPDQYMGDVSGDLNQRRGRILGMSMEEGMQVVQAEVPLAEMHTYSSQLRSITQGRGSFEMQFARYEQVPGNVAKQIQEAAAKEAEEENA